MSTALARQFELDDELALYYREVSRFDLLSAEEELTLARRWSREGDAAAAHRLVTGNLRFVIKIANEYRRYRFRLLDLIQEGNVGLMRAVHKFDPERGFRLITYAVWWIRAHIHEFILRSWSLVRIGTTRLQRKLFHRLQSAQARIRALIGREDDGAGVPVDEDALIAAEMDISVEEVTDFRRRIQSPDLSLDEQVHDDGTLTMKDRVRDQAPDPETVVGEIEARTQLAGRLDEAVAQLTEREQLVIRERLLRDEPVTLKELGVRLGVSKERVRQLEARAKKKLRSSLADCELSVA